MNKQEIEAMKEAIMRMPEDIQNTVYWVIKHLDIIDYVVQGEKLSQAEIEELTKKAMEKNNLTLLAILLYKQAYDKTVEKEFTEGEADSGK